MLNSYQIFFWFMLTIYCSPFEDINSWLFTYINTVQMYCWLPVALQRKIHDCICRSWVTTMCKRYVRFFRMLWHLGSVILSLLNLNICAIREKRMYQLKDLISFTTYLLTQHHSDIEEHLGVTIDQCKTDLIFAASKFNDKVAYRQQRNVGKNNI